MRQHERVGLCRECINNPERCQGRFRDEAARGIHCGLFQDGTRRRLDELESEIQRLMIAMEQSNE